MFFLHFSGGGRPAVLSADRSFVAWLVVELWAGAVGRTIPAKFNFKTEREKKKFPPTVEKFPH